MAFQQLAGHCMSSGRPCSEVWSRLRKQGLLKKATTFKKWICALSSFTFCHENACESSCGR